VSVTLPSDTRATPPCIEPGAVTVITPSLPGRIKQLAECMDSVAQQTWPVVHLIRADVDRIGPALIRNQLIEEATTDLVAFLDDDDLIDPDHVEALVAALEDTGAELAWSWHRTEGKGAAKTPRPGNAAAVRAAMYGGRNVIPVTVVAHREAIVEAGGFSPHDRYEDYALWMRMLSLGHEFALVKRETWTYRFLGGNRTWLNR
jgi:glycosyltransferase involved in cell wall biosynthesis